MATVCWFASLHSPRRARMDRTSRRAERTWRLGALTACCASSRPAKILLRSRPSRPRRRCWCRRVEGIIPQTKANVEKTTTVVGELICMHCRQVYFFSYAIVICTFSWIFLTLRNRRNSNFVVRMGRRERAICAGSCREKDLMRMAGYTTISNTKVTKEDRNWSI